MKKIKILTLLLALPLLVLSVGCKKKGVNPDPNPSPNDSTSTPPPVQVDRYVGTWNGIDQTFKVVVGGMPLYNDDKEFDEGEYVLEIGANDSLTLTFPQPIVNTPTTQKLAYQIVDKSTIKFTLGITNPIPIGLEATFRVSNASDNVGKLSIDEDGIDLPMVGNARIEMDVNVAK